MNVLVLNCGSSTLKFQLIETAETSRAERKLARGLVDRIGGNASYRFDWNGNGLEAKPLPLATHEEAVRLVIEWLAIQRWISGKVTPWTARHGSLRERCRPFLWVGWA